MTLWPSWPTTAAAMSAGMMMIMSVNRMSTASVLPRKKPALDPMSDPTSAAMRRRAP